MFDWSDAVKNALSSDPDFVPPSDVESDEEEPEIEQAEDAALIDQRQLAIVEQRTGAREAQAKQAEKMLQESEKRLAN